MPRSLLRRTGVSGGAAPLMPANFSAEFYDDTIVPSIGTAGTFTRASTFDYMLTANTVGQVASGSPALGAAPSDPTAPAGPTGVFLSNNVVNYFLWNEDFSNVAWVKNGTASVVTDSVVAPDGNSTADTLVGAAAGDGVQQATARAANAGSRGYQLAVWLKVSTGTHTVTLKQRGDSGGTPEEDTKNVTVTTDWQPFYHPRLFTAGVTGNLEGEIEFNDTTGKSLYAWRPQNHECTGTSGTRWGWITPWTKTEGATATTASNVLRYQGAEITDAATTSMTYAMWYYYFTDTIASYNYWPLMHQSADGDNAFYLNKTTLMATCDGVNKAFPSLPPSGRWSLIEFTINYTANEVRQYLNGVKVGTVAGAQTEQSSFGQLRVGSHDANFQNAGVIGSVQIYRGLDSDTDATARYDEQKGYFGL